MVHGVRSLDVAQVAATHVVVARVRLPVIHVPRAARHAPTLARLLVHLVAVKK